MIQLVFKYYLLYYYYNSKILNENQCYFSIINMLLCFLLTESDFTVVFHFTFSFLILVKVTVILFCFCHFFLFLSFTRVYK